MKSVPPGYFVICPDSLSFFPSSPLITGAIMFLCGLFAQCLVSPLDLTLREVRGRLFVHLCLRSICVTW